MSKKGYLMHYVSLSSVSHIVKGKDQNNEKYIFYLAVSKKDVLLPHCLISLLNKNNMAYRLGIDIGSTTLKAALLDEGNRLVAWDYRRHQADVCGTGLRVLKSLREKAIGDADGGKVEVRLTVTGSVGMGVAERLELPFVQEVVASVATIEGWYKDVRTFVDIGGEDSKMIFFSPGAVPDIRMNGSCAGGTGAFIDQTATLLGVDTGDLDRLAGESETIYPIASRCGVFSKTDIQNLIAGKVSKADIAASVFHSVAEQVIGSLARGRDIEPKIFFCGGPFAYLPHLRKAFLTLLKADETDTVIPQQPQLIPAVGCALLSGRERQGEGTVTLKELIEKWERLGTGSSDYKLRLPPLFRDEYDYLQWVKRKEQYHLPTATAHNGEPLYLGVDSGSTTTKIVLVNKSKHIVYTDYLRNEGDSFHAFSSGLVRMRDVLSRSGLTDIQIAGSCATGYGESLLKTAFSLDYGVVETMAHFRGAKEVMNDVEFVLDIGGQDMKAIWSEHGTIKRIEINEACSSGCGSFLETFARQMGYDIAEFARMSCTAQHPCDLGTRCTVFMNSKVKQAMREGADVADIAAGFSYSVVKNCLYKVLKLKDVSQTGRHIVVQGGTMRNHSVVRALERLTGVDVVFTDYPELMGAYGAALYAMEKQQEERSKP